MGNDVNLLNAATIGENPETSFIAEGNRLHAVERHVAELQKDKSNPEHVLPLIRDALKALTQFAQGKVEPHFLQEDWKEFFKKSNEKDQLLQKIQHIYSHLPHHDRNELSSMIHHKQAKGR